MQQVKDFLNFIDIFVGMFWSFTMIEVMPIILSGQIATNLLSSMSGFVNLLVAIAGLIYLAVRTVHFYKMSKLHIQLKKEEIIEKQNANFYGKWNKNFLEPKTKKDDNTREIN